MTIPNTDMLLRKEDPLTFGLRNRRVFDFFLPRANSFILVTASAFVGDIKYVLLAIQLRLLTGIRIE